MELYKYALQKKLRFPSSRGELTVEQLFDLPLIAANNFSLDAVAKRIHADLKAAGEESFVEVSNPQKRVLEIQLDIVKDVIATKQAENAAALARTKKREERRKILEAMENKKDEALSKASLKTLEAKLAALDDDEEQPEK